MPKTTMKKVVEEVRREIDLAVEQADEDLTRLIKLLHKKDLKQTYDVACGLQNCANRIVEGVNLLKRIG